MDKRGKTDGKAEISAGGKVETLWRTRAEFCAQFGIGKTTLYKRIKAGDIQKKRGGNRTLYRWTSGNLAEFPRTNTERSGGKAETPTADKYGKVESADGGTDYLSLIERMADKIAALERDKAHLSHERDEALTVGHKIADERDKLADDKVQMMSLFAQAHEALVQSNDNVRCLHSAIDALTDAVAMVCASPLAVPVRRRLWAALATC